MPHEEFIAWDPYAPQLGSSLALRGSNHSLRDHPAAVGADKDTISNVIERRAFGSSRVHGLGASLTNRSGYQRPFIGKGYQRHDRQPPRCWLADKVKRVCLVPDQCHLFLSTTISCGWVSR